MKENIGIYQILNTETLKSYIGSSKNIKRRWTKHKWSLKNGKHHSLYLQRSFDKYGIDNFKIIILENCEVEDLFFKESEWIENIKPEYNVGSVGGGDNLTNHPRREEIIQNIKTAVLKRNEEYTDEEIREKFGMLMDKNPNWRGGTSKKVCSCGSPKSFNAKTCSSCRPRSGKSNPFYNKAHSDETKNKLSKKKLGRYHGNQETPVCIHGVRYRSLSLASRELGINASTILHRIKTGKDGYSRPSE